MKYFYYIAFCWTIFGCSEKAKPNDYCVSSLTYKSRKYELISDLVTLNIQDRRHLILSKIKSQPIEKVLFYSIKSEDRESFPVWSTESHQDSISVRIPTSFFNSEQGRKVWKSKEVENLLLKDSVGLVIGKDLFIVKNCK